LRDRLEEGRERDEFLEQRLRLKALQVSISEWLSLADAGQVYWGERAGEGDRHHPAQCAARHRAGAARPPLRVRDERACAPAPRSPSPANSMPSPGAWARTAPAAPPSRPRSTTTGRRGSSSRRMFPLPSPQDARLAVESLIDWVRFCALRVAGGTLVLFTSYADLRGGRSRAGERVPRRRPTPASAGRCALATELAAMRRLGNAVLFGTESFWTGVDIPGAASRR
jgi:ATP-dependent DNA helicase DinG